jgi:hypothetical protein
MPDLIANIIPEFSKFVKKLPFKSSLYFARPTNIHLKKFRQTLKTAPHCGKF